MFTPAQYKKTVLAIFKQRNFLLKNKLSGKNESRCHSIIKKLKLQVDAYGSKWNSDGWAAFIARNIHEFDYLIPSNVAGDSVRDKITTLLKNT